MKVIRPAAQQGEEIDMKLTVNGTVHQLTVTEDMPLLWVLRDVLGLTGTKENCLDAECGVCTVLLDGAAVNACILLAVQCRDRRIVTIEGLAPGGALHPLQRAFIDRGAVQCGYCIPGMILAAKACLDDDPEAGEEDVREALAGNLCRCTGYQKIVEAVLAVARAGAAGAR